MHSTRRFPVRAVFVSAVFLGCSGGDTPTAATSPPDVTAAKPGALGAHVNQADPVFATLAAPNGEAVDVLGDRDAAGRPTRLTGMRRVASNGSASDWVTFGTAGLPTNIALRDGARFALEYAPSGTVVLTVQLPGGATKTTSFRWLPRSAGRAAVRTMPNRLAAASGGASAAAGQPAGTVDVFFLVNESPGGDAVEEAAITGTWASHLTGGPFVAAPAGAPGTYVARLPSRPVSGVEQQVKAQCAALDSLVGQTCELLSLGTDPGSGVPYNPAQPVALAQAAKAACIVLAAGDLPLCEGLGDALALACTIRDRCGVATAALDYFVQQDAALKITADVVVTDVHLGVSATFPTPVNTTIRVAFESLVDRVELTPSAPTVNSGKFVVLTARALRPSGRELSSRRFVWAPLASEFATLTASGPTAAVTGTKAGGAATVTVTTGGKSASTSVTVTASARFAGGWTLTEAYGSPLPAPHDGAPSILTTGGSLELRADSTATYVYESAFPYERADENPLTGRDRIVWTGTWADRGNQQGVLTFTAYTREITGQPPFRTPPSYTSQGTIALDATDRLSLVFADGTRRPFVFKRR